jgi:hypothetical protein
MHPYSGVLHGSVPDSELIEKNGRTYYPFASPLRDIKEDIQYHKHRCWGLVVYRCDYTSDELWEKFMSNMRYRIEDALTANKAEDLKDTLELTVREDKENPNGANVEQVRGSSRTGCKATKQNRKWDKAHHAAHSNLQDTRTAYTPMPT